MSSEPWLKCVFAHGLRASRGAPSVPPLHTRALDVVLAALTSRVAGGRPRRLKLLSTSLSIASAVLAVTPDLRAQEPTRLPLSSSSPAQNEDAAPDHSVAVGLVLGGLLATTVGWIMFAGGGPNVHELDYKPVAHVRDQRLQFGVLALPRGGWGVGLSTLF